MAHQPHIETFNPDRLQALLGPAESQYQTLTLSIQGDAGAIACGSTVTDNDANDQDPAVGNFNYFLVWNDLPAETGYRSQVDFGSSTFVTEDSFLEHSANQTTQGRNHAVGATDTHRVFGHVGHAPFHGATPIAGDVVSNECSLTVNAIPS